MARTQRSFSLGVLLLGLGVVLFALGAKLALIHRYGTDQPYADQWAAEGMFLLRNPLNFDLNLAMVTAPHGEHRPGLMRLWVRGLIVANDGQWDCFVELVADLLIYGAFLAVAWRWVASLFSGRWLSFVAVLLAVLFALPCVYENYLWGFQSQFLFMFLCGLLHVYGTLADPRPGVRWWLGQFAGLLGLFSIAAGSMSAAALVAMAVIEFLRGRRTAWVWSTLAANIVLLGFGVWLLPAAAVSAAPLSDRLAQVLAGLRYLLGWPWPGAWWSIALQIPWVVLLVTTWRHWVKPTGDRMVCATGLWVGGMAFAIAYGRAVTPTTIGVRYYDVLVLGLVVNVLALALFASSGPPRFRRWWVAIGAVWLAVVGTGLWHYNEPGELQALFKFQHDYALEQRQLVKEFLVTDNPAQLQEFANASGRFPHFQLTLELLRDPDVRSLLPPSLTVDGHAGVLTWIARRIARGWTLVFGAGVLGLIGGAFLLRRGEAKLPPAPSPA